MINYWFVLISVISWGIGYFLYKIALNKISYLLLVSVTTVLYVLVIPIILYLYKPIMNYSWQGILIGLIGSVFLGIGSIFYYISLQNSNNTGLITLATSCYPIVTLFLSFLFLHESLSLNKIIACILIGFSYYLLFK